jgi:hypothetical protein
MAKVRYFKSGNVKLALKELGYTEDNKIKYWFKISIGDKVYYSSDDLNVPTFRGIKSAAIDALGFMIEGDFLPEEDRQELENSAEYGEFDYLVNWIIA